MSNEMKDDTAEEVGEAVVCKGVQGVSFLGPHVSANLKVTNAPSQNSAPLPYVVGSLI